LGATRVAGAAVCLTDYSGHHDDPGRRRQDDDSGHYADERDRMM
jgi:hypothetical protein